jgi:energy-coupling factor transporter ATP-binding protein EcfA2
MKALFFKRTGTALYNERSKIQTESWKLKSEVTSQLLQIGISDSNDLIEQSIRSRSEAVDAISIKLEPAAVSKLQSLLRDNTNIALDLLFYFYGSMAQGKQDFVDLASLKDEITNIGALLIPLNQEGIDANRVSIAPGLNIKFSNPEADLAIARDRLEVFFDGLEAPLEGITYSTNTEHKIIFDNCLFNMLGKKLKIDHFEITQGQALRVKGDNGIGKSVLFQAVKGLIPWPIERSGEISTPAHASIWMDQKTYVPPASSLLEVIMQKQKATITEGERAKVIQLCNDLGLSDKIGLLEDNTKDLSTLSNGEKNKVTIIRAIMMHRDFTFLDEPFSGLSAVAAKKAAEVLKREFEGLTLVTIDHTTYCDDLYTAEQDFNEFVVHASSAAAAMVDECKMSGESGAANLVE